jgi:hypothetical protein
MATTTNYSWSTPDDTALVKDGAAAIRSLGTAIDSTVFTNAGAAINKTIVDAKGDLIIGSAADTVARLAVGGTNGHVLTVNSGATYGAEWAALPPAGGMTLISTTTLSGATVSLSSIPSTYKHLLLVVSDATNATGNGYFNVAPNGSSSITDSGNVEAFHNDTTGGDTATATKINVNWNTAMKNTGGKNAAALWIYNYASTTLTKPYGGSYHYETGSSLIFTGTLMGRIATTSAISSLDLANSGGSFNGGSALLYGVS